MHCNGAVDRTPGAKVVRGTQRPSGGGQAGSGAHSRLAHIPVGVSSYQTSLL